MKNIPKYICVVVLFLLFLNPGWAREQISFNNDWQMLKGDYSIETIGEAGDGLFEPVRLPHDWAISQGPVKGISMKNYGHYPLPGTYWYRKHIVLPEGDRDRLISLYFEGIMRDATIYLNGKQVGRWVYGYTSFEVELTSHLKFGEGEVNELLVHLHLPKKFTRWYTGAGIYRDVWMIKTDPVHFAQGGVFCTTPTVSDDYAIVNVETEINSPVNFSGKGVVDALILDQEGEIVARGQRSAELRAGTAANVTQELKLMQPNRWDIDYPYLYTVVTRLKIEEEVVDELETTLGIRTFRFDAQKGFFLNGRKVMIYGVNNHHDLGPLGTAFNLRAAERQLEILREMGCNAIRTAHNPPAPGLLDLCDRMGFLVMNELFDSWTLHKGIHDEGYTPAHWEEWWKKDVEAFVRRDRNHPSVIIWSTGNEIPEQNHKKLAGLSREITDEFHKYDPTRPVTAGFNKNVEAVENGFVDTVDVVGWNYATKFGDWYNDFRARPEFKDKPQIATVTVSTQSSRGYYRFPYGDPYQNSPEKQACSYVMRAPGYGLPPDMELMRQATSPSISGEFVWTGFDYIGEPWPYYDDSTLSYYGILDLCGFPKDIFYNYQSAWRPDHDMVHILPHWTWPGREGELTPIHAFTNGDEAELFVNGKSHGKRLKGEGNTMINSVNRHDAGTLAKFTNRMIWEDVIYEPGQIKVIAWKDGEKIAERTVSTAGKVARLHLTADRQTIRADYDDLAFITVDALDDAGRFVPNFNGDLEFLVEGEGEIVALGNGNPNDFTPMQGGSTFTAFNGKCLAVVRGLDGKPGSITLRVRGVPAADDDDPDTAVDHEGGEISITTEL